MKILLLNDNPVVNKLVTLSAQKTSDELEVVESFDNINEGTYDLLVVDDTLYEDTLFQNLEGKITFTETLYICSKDSENAGEFSRTIKKPFLPTDLVELFSVIGKVVTEEEPIDENVLDELEEDNAILLDDVVSSDEEESVNLDDEEALIDLDSEVSTNELEDTLEEELSSTVLDNDDLQEVKDLLDMTEDEESESTDDVETSELDLEEELSQELEEDLSLDDLELAEEDLEEELEIELDDESLEEDLTLGLVEKLGLDLDDNELPDEELDKILDEDTSTEVDELVLEDAEEELEIELDDESLEEDLSKELDELTLDETLEVEKPIEEELNFDEALESEEKLEELSEVFEEDLTKELDELILDDELDMEDELSLADDLELRDDVEEELNIESEIEKAMSELSQEDLDSEIDENTLVDIVTNEIDSLDTLNARDLKIAIGEDVDEVAEKINTDSDDSNDDITLAVEKNNEVNTGVESLKKLLEVLSDKDIAASMKGMKITINIELGDN